MATDTKFKGLSEVGPRSPRLLNQGRAGLAASGFTIVEVLIAATLGIFLLSGITQILSNTATNKAVNNGLSAVQESGRYALKMISESVRYRGFQGCILPVSLDPKGVDSVDWDNVSQTTSKANGFAMPDFSSSSLRGYEVSDSGVWTPDPSAQGFSSDMVALRGGEDDFTPIAGSDVISVQYASPRSVSVSADMATLSDNVSISDNSLGIESDSIVFVGDCTLGDVFKVSGEVGSSAPFSLKHASTHNDSNLLRRPYGTDAQVRLFQTQTFFVAETGRVDQTGNPVPALFRKDINGDVVELIEGIERLEIRYGELLSSGNIRYVSADAMTADVWPRVVTVELGILARTTHQVLSQTDESSFTLPGELVTPEESSAYTPGRYLRKSFTTLIEVRNRA